MLRVIFLPDQLVTNVSRYEKNNVRNGKNTLENFIG